MFDFITTAMEAYMIYWRGPVELVLASTLPDWAILVPEYLFLATSFFVAVNFGLLFTLGVSVWGWFDGDKSPLLASVKICLLYSFLPIITMMWFTSTRWNEQDQATSVLASWVGLIATLSWVANTLPH